MLKWQEQQQKINGIYNSTRHKHMCVCYLRVVGHWHSDAVLIGDVVGAVIWRARARAGCAATCRVWNAQTHKSNTRNQQQRGVKLSEPFASYLPCRASASWRWWWGCLGDAAADCSYARSPSASAGSAASGWAQTLREDWKETKFFFWNPIWTLLW